MSSIMRMSQNVLYWASQRLGGKDVGHVAAAVGPYYLSHRPDLLATKIPLGKRPDLGGLQVDRVPSLPPRTIEDDKAYWGGLPKVIAIPVWIAYEPMATTLRERFLSTPSRDGRLQGPLLPYQIANAPKDTKNIEHQDWKAVQCATEVIETLVPGLPEFEGKEAVARNLIALPYPDIVAKKIELLSEKFANAPGKEILAEFEAIDQWFKNLPR